MRVGNPVGAVGALLAWGLLFISVWTVGCGGSGGGGSSEVTPTPTPTATATATPTPTPTATLSGTVFKGTAVKGAIAGGAVQLFNRLTAGDTGALKGSATTGSDGTFSIETGGFLNSAFLRCTGGTYVDEATGITRTLQVPLDGFVYDVVPGDTHTANLTPLTSWIVQRTIASGAFDSISLQRATNEIGGLLGGMDPRITPASPLLADSGDTRAADYGLVLAGIARLAQTLGVSPDALAAALGQDLADGAIDGRAGSQPLILGSTNLSTRPIGSDLVDHILLFALSTRNVSGRLPSENLLFRLAAATGALPDGTAPVAVVSDDQVVSVGSTVDLTGSIPGGGTVTSFTWSQVSGPLIALSTTSGPTTRFTAATPGVVVVQLNASAAARSAAPVRTRVVVRGPGATLNVRAVACAPLTVSRSQAFNMVVGVQNLGQTAANVSAVTPSFRTVLGADVTSQFTVVPGANPTTVGAGAIAAFSFTVTPGPTATQGEVVADASVTGTDASSGGATNDTSSEITCRVTVATNPAVQIQSFTVPATVDMGTSFALSAVLRNNGQAAATLQSVNLSFSDSGGVTRTNQYTVTPDAANETTLAAGATTTWRANVALVSPATPGTITVNGGVTFRDPTGLVGSTATAVTPRTFVVNVPNALLISRVSGPATANVAQSVTLTVALTNGTPTAATLDSVTLSFRQGGTDVASSFAVTPGGGNPTSLAAGQTANLTFDVVGSTSLANVTVDAAAAYTVAGQARTAPSAAVPLDLSVQTQAAIAIGGILAPAAVSRGQLATLIVPVTNSGQATALSMVVAPRFTDSGSVVRTADYTLTPAVTNPTQLTGGQTANFTFSVSVNTTATLGAITIDATATGTDANTTAALNDGAAATAATWQVQVPASLALNSVVRSAALVTQGANFTVTVNAQNTGGATINVSATATRPTFTGAASADRAAFYSIEPSGTNPTTIAGGATAAFDYTVTAALNAPTESVTVNALVNGTDANSGVALNAGPLGAGPTMTVQRRATFDIVNTIAPTPILASNTYTVTMTVANPGAVTANVASQGLTFTQGAVNRDADYVVTPITTPATVTGGTTVSFVYSVTVNASATAGLTVIDGTISGTDASTGLAISDNAATTAASWTFATPAILSITRTTAQPAVTLGQTATVSMTIANTGGAPVSINSSTLSFRSGAINVDAQYTVTPSPSNPTTILLGTSATLSYSVVVNGAATLGAVSIDGSIDATDIIFSNPVTDTGATTVHTWTVQQPPTLTVTGVTIPAQVAQGQTVPVRIGVANGGQAALRAPAATVIFTGPGPVSRDAEYSAIAAGSNPASVAGGTSGELLYLVTVGPTATLSTVSVSANVTATDFNSGAPLAASSGGVAPTWNVVPGAAFQIPSLIVSPSTLSQGQTFNVTISLRNAGTAPGRLNATSLNVVQGGASVASEYIIVADPSNATIINAGTTVTLSYRVTADGGATRGLLTFTATLFGADFNSGSPISATGPAVPANALMQSPPAIVADRVTVTPNRVFQTESLFVTLTARNLGEATFNVTEARVRFTTAGNDDTANYVQTPIVGSQTTITGNSTATFQLEVQVGSKATPGFTTIDSAIRGTDANSGQILGDNTSVITTSAAIQRLDTTGPKFRFTNPPNGAINVQTNTDLYVTFDRPVNPLTVTTASFSFAQATTPTVNIPVTAVTRLFPDRQTWRVQVASAPLSQNTTYALILSNLVHDLAGNPSEGDLSRFSTSLEATRLGTAPPSFQTTQPLIFGLSLRNVNPAHNRHNVPVNSEIRAQWRGNIDPATVDTQSVRFYRYTSPPVELSLASVTIATQPLNTVILTPSVPLTLDTTYGVIVSNRVRDIAGMPVASQDALFSTSVVTPRAGTLFERTTTVQGAPDQDGPAFLSMNPEHTRVNVLSSTRIIVTLTEPANPASVVAANFRLWEQDGYNPAVPITIASVTPVASPPNSFELVTATSLQRNRSYVVAMNNRVLDTLGNAGPGEDRVFRTFIDKDRLTGLTSRSQEPSPDTTGPSFLLSSLGSAGNSFCDPIEFTFTEPVVPSTLTANGNVQLFTTVQTLAGQSAYTQKTIGGVTLKPSQANTIVVTGVSLEQNSKDFTYTHVLVVNNRVPDLTGNASPGESFGFTIDTLGDCCDDAVSCCCGQIFSAVSPPNQKSNVPVNTRVIIQFLDDVDESTIQANVSLVTANLAGDNSNLCGTNGLFPLAGVPVPCTVQRVPTVARTFELIPTTNGGLLLPDQLYGVVQTGFGLKLLNGRFAKCSQTLNSTVFTTANTPIPSTGFPTPALDASLVHAQIAAPSGFYGQGILDATPFNARFNVRTPSRLFLTLDRNVNASTVNPQSLVLQTFGTNPTQIPLSSVRLDPGPKADTYELVPQFALTANTTYTMHVTNRVLDQTGRPAAPDEVYFSTDLEPKKFGNYVPRGAQPTPDTTGPIFVMSPPRKANIHPANRVWLQFDEAVTASTLTSNASHVILSRDVDTTPADLTRTLTSAGVPNLFQITPSAPLSIPTTYGLFLTDNVRDAANNFAGGQESFFETRVDFTTFGRGLPSILTTNPAVVGPFITIPNPANGRSTVPVESRILLTLSKPVNAATVPGNVILRQLSGTAADLPATLVPAAAPPNTFEVVPSAPLTSLTTYGVYLTNNVRDTTGLPSLTDEFYFQTEELETSVGSQNPTSWTTIPAFGPVLTNRNPANRRFNVQPTTRIILTFNEPVSAASFTDPRSVVVARITTPTFTRIPLSGPIVAVPQPPNSFEVPVASANLTRNATYAVIVTNRVTDTAGNPSPGDSFQFSTVTTLASMFQTVPTSERADVATFGPVLLDGSPLNAKQNVSPRTRILFRYNTSVTNVDTSSVSLLVVPPSGPVVTVPGTVAATSPANTFEFIPASLPLSFNTTYALALTNGVRTAAGRASPGDEFYFSTRIDPASTFGTYPTTRRADLANGPILLSSTPSNGRFNVQLTSRILFTFNQPMLDATLNVTSVTLVRSTTPEILVPATSVVRLTPPNTYELVLPPGTLTANTNYVLQVNNFAQSVAGQRCPGDEFSFSTSTTRTGLGDTVPVTQRGNPALVGPVLLSSNPANLEDNVRLNSRVLMTFNTTVTDVSVTGAGSVVYKRLEGVGGEAIIPATVARIPVPANTYEVTPSVGLTADTTYAVFVTNRVETPEGVPCPGDEFLFSTTVTQTATNNPGLGRELSIVNPLHDRLNVMLNSRILATFNQPMLPASLTNSVQVGVLTTGLITPVSIANIVPVTMPPNTFELQLSAGLTPNTTYAVTVSNLAQTADGVAIPAFFSKFGTAIVKSRLGTRPVTAVIENPQIFGPVPDTFNPTITAVNILPQSRVFVTLTGAVKPPGINDVRLMTIEPTLTTVPLTQVLPVTAPPNTIELVPSAPLTPNTTYGVFVTNRVLAPSDLAAQGGDSLFSTRITTQTIGTEVYDRSTDSPDFVGPFLADTNPTSRTFNVPVQTELHYTFNEPIIDSSLISFPNRSVALYRLTTPIIDLGPVTVTKLTTPVNSYRMVLSPPANLQPNTDYAMFLTNNVQDRVGNHAQSGSIKFSTRIRLDGALLSARNVFGSLLAQGLGAGVNNVGSIPVLAVSQLILAERLAIGEITGALVTVRNTGDSGVTVTGTTLHFGRDDVEVTPAPGNPTVVPAGASVALGLTVRPRESAASGITNVAAQVDGRQASTGNPVTGFSAVKAVELSRGAQVASTSLEAPSSVRTGDTVMVRLSIANSGEMPARVTNVALGFTGAVDRAGDYAAVRATPLPAQVPAGGHLDVDFQVAVRTTATLFEQVQLTAAVSAANASSGAELTVAPHPFTAWITVPSGAVTAALRPQAGRLVTKPGGLATDGRRAYVVDTANDRIVVYDLATTPGFEVPLFVLGSSQGTGGITALTFSRPTGIACDGTRLALADTGNHRVLVWDALPQQPGTMPDHIVGQTSSLNVAANAGGLGARSLSGPTGVAFAAGRLVVADTGNNRVLVYPGTLAPTATLAAFALGQPGVTTGQANAGGTTLSTMAAPGAVLWDGSALWVADTANRRVLVWDGFPAGSGDLPDATLMAPLLPLSEPAGLAAAGGVVTIADRAGRAVYGVTRDATAARPLDTLHGTPVVPFTGGPTLEAPAALLALPNLLYIADPPADRVWRIGTGR